MVAGGVEVEVGDRDVGGLVPLEDGAEQRGDVLIRVSRAFEPQIADVAIDEDLLVVAGKEEMPLPWMSFLRISTLIAPVPQVVATFT